MHTVDPKKKDYIGVNHKKEFIYSDGCPMANQGPKFYKQRGPTGHLLTGAPHLLCMIRRTSG